MTASLRRPIAWLGERVADLAATLSGVRWMSSADRARWAQAGSLADVGELTAQWLEGRIGAQPGYCGSVDVDEHDAPGLTDALVACNRAGFVTTDSQAGCDIYDERGNHWQQYAAVRGFADAHTVDWLRDTVADAGLHMTRCAKATLFTAVDPVTLCNGRVVTDFGNRVREGGLRDGWTGYGICHPAAVQDLVAAEQVVIRDSEFGRNDRLWPALRAACGQRATADSAHSGQTSGTGRAPVDRWRDDDTDGM